jgi:hypothetical protein
MEGGVAGERAGVLGFDHSAADSASQREEGAGRGRSSVFRSRMAGCMKWIV